MKEKWRTVRLKEENEVTIVVSDKNNSPKDKIINSYSMDISVYGTKIQTNVFLPVDTLLNINFTLKDLQQKINAIGKVKWIKVVIVDESYEQGVEFVTPLRKLQDYMTWKLHPTS